MIYGFFRFFKRMVLTPIESSKIFKQMETYRIAVGTFGYGMAIQDKINRMLGKLKVQFVSNFQISMPFLFIYLLLGGNIICCLSLFVSLL